ncbi:MAG: hypothetical protein H0V44_13280 [Planctomycetes bacterium]|nr:hypothetical protein [Planctomycetota bacterium]
MPTLVQIGAGNIGRGFIAPTFAQAGWSVVLVDIDRRRIEAARTRGRYTVTEVDNGGSRLVPVAPVTGVDAADQDAVVDVLAACDLASTAVGLNALARLGPVLARGLIARWAAGRDTLDVLLCENGATADAILREAVMSALPAEQRARARASLGIVRTSIGRMIPPGDEVDALDIAVEPYAHLPVDRAGFVGAIPVVPHLEPRADFDLVLGQKLYLHNLTHACLAYAGCARGLATIPDCMEDAALVAGARRAGEEASEALARAHGGTAAGRARVLAECTDLLEALFVRYRNRALADPVARVARDPVRKLAVDDRLVGAARLCLAHGVQPKAILAHILLACDHIVAADDPGAALWRSLQGRGALATIAAITKLPPEDPFMRALDLSDRRRQATQSMRAAGLVITDPEADLVEIADFGLGRFEQFGLAIHVYVNTARCCAKELVMLPGQICPEHRHPPIPGGAAEGGDPGKEETFRVRQGEVHLFLPGHHKDGAERTFALGLVPEDKRDAVTVFKHVHLTPGSQYTLKPNTPHWFVAGTEGAIVSEFSTRSRDEADVFTDPAIVRVPDPA